MTKPVSLPGLQTIKATAIQTPPSWALKQLELMTLNEDSAVITAEKFAEKGGVLYYKDDLDDLFEPFFNWSLLYALGGGERLFDYALRDYNAMTRARDDRHEHVRKGFRPQVHNEYYNLNQPNDWPPGNRLCSEWHHQSEGNMLFYSFGLADPTISENVRRARRFAAMFMGDDPEAPNWDAKNKLLRSPMQTSQGPYLKANSVHVQQWLHGAHKGGPRPIVKPMGVRATLYPIVKELEMDWMNDPKREQEIIDIFNRVVLDCDTPNNLAATALITNAYLYTGDEKYKKWVLDYTGAWMDRTKKNNGILPDNVGPTGKIGEHRNGQWWGSLYGWNHYQGLNIMYHGMVTAAECAQLLSGDSGYMDFIRSQVRMLLKNSKKNPNGQRVVPTRYGPKGWETYMPIRIFEMAHLYHGTLSKEDYDIFAEIREGDVDRDWNTVEPDGEKNGQNQDGHQHMARFNYYDGKNPSWPDQILDSDFGLALKENYRARNASDTIEEMLEDKRAGPGHAVFTKGLTQVQLGTVQTNYNGGLLRATVRYFDQDRSRPGLPPDVAAFVDELKADRAGISLVNTGLTETRNVIVYAGAFGEHSFTDVKHREIDHSTYSLKGGTKATVKDHVVPVNGKYFAVQLPPGKGIRVEAGMKRFVNKPSYAFPWHGDAIPVPFQ